MTTTKNATISRLLLCTLVASTCSKTLAASINPNVLDTTDVIENPAPKRITSPATEIRPAPLNLPTIETQDYGFVPKLNPFATSDGKFKVAKNANRKTVALALGGGGVRGAAHIGVLRVLEKADVPIDYIVGNSMGAIVGGLYAAGVDMQTFASRKTIYSFRKAYVPEAQMGIFKLPLSFILKTFSSLPAGIASGKRYEIFLRRQIPEGREQIESLNIPFWLLSRI